MHFAFVTFVNTDDAEKAISSLNNSLFMGRNIWYGPLVICND
jgi:RNA recognition motif-containing protein